MKAVNLEQVIRYFDPRKPLRGQELQFWFTERPASPRRRLEVFLRAERDPVKVLFVGHRGSGKTTELNKLAEGLIDRYHAIGFSALDVIGRTNMDNEPDEQRLLHNGTLIEYHNDEPWCDAHPVLWYLLEQNDDET